MIDIGANLTNESFRSDLDEVVKRAQISGVKNIIVTGTSAECALEARSLALSYPGYLYSTAGLHPHHAKDFNEQVISIFRELLEQPEVVAIGETGLDFNRNFSSPELQISCFESILELGKDFDKPFFLHERDSFETFHTIMSNRLDICERSIVHCFTGSKQALKAYLDLGMHIGVTGWICDQKRGQNLREIISYAPLDRLMIETDAPYLMPYRDKLKKQMKHKHRNEPCTLQYTLKALAEVLKVDVAELENQTSANTRRFFGLP